MRLVALGVALGLLLAFGAASSLEGFVACLVPARRAMQLDPLVALRYR